MKIKTCPFCGGKARLWIRKCDKTKYTIGCDNVTCFLWIPEDVRLRELHNYAPCYVEKKQLIEDWNKRPPTNKVKIQPSVRANPDVIELGGGKFWKKIIKLFKKKG